jgi:hypothetical protein
MSCIEGEKKYTNNALNHNTINRIIRKVP